MTGWEPIDTAPDDGSEIDFWIECEGDGWRQPDVWYSRGLEKFVYRLHQEGMPVQYAEAKGATHWRLKPEAPESDKGSKAVKLEDKTIFKDHLIKMRAEMITERSTLSSPGITIEMNGQDIKPQEIDWLTRQAAELSKLIEALEEEGA